MTKRISRILIMTLFIALFAITFSFAQSNELSYTKTASGGDIVLKVNGNAKSIYMIFNLTPGQYSVNGKAVENSYFLQQFVELDSCSEIKISGADPREIHVFDGSDAPEWVHIWQAPCEKADILLISSHADDEQLFFAGLLPYYTQVRGLKVQVAYATDHSDQISRHQERLNGLYAVGVRHYPVSSGYRDLYSESYEQALANLNAYGVKESDIIAWEKELLNQFKPQVLVTHDVNGEYGHGMHKLVNGTLQKALENAEPEFPFLMKVYFHLYDKNEISFDLIDQSFTELNGLTPFQVTQQKGFAAHESQHWTWFKGWIYGKASQITKASQIETYSPLKYGLWYSNAEPDTAKNDLFENLISYEEQRQAEEARIAEEARLAAEEAKAQAEELAKLEEKSKSVKTLGILGIVAIIIIVIIVILAKSKPKKQKYHSKH